MNNSLQIYKEAQRVISEYGTRDPERIAKEMGIKIKYCDSLSDLLGLYTYYLKSRIILINSNLSDIQRKMVLAHELGHDILHRDMSKSGIKEYQIFDMKTPMEYEANAFASHLLISNEELVEKIISTNSDAWHIASEFNVNVNLILIKMQEMNKLGYRLNVPLNPDPKFFRDESPDGNEWDKY